MPRAAILLAGFALLSALVNVAVGIGVGLGLVGVRFHAFLAVPSNVLALFAWTLVALYFAGSVAWTQEEVLRVKGDPVLGDEARALLPGIYPWISAAVLSLIAAYVLGGGADTGAVSPLVHLALALITLFLHLVAAYRTVLHVGLVLDIQGRIEV